MFKKILAFILGFVWICIPLPAFAAGEQITYSENDYTFTLNAKGFATITGYSGPGGHVDVPWSLGGVEVVGIGAKAFYGNETITSLNVPNSITSIGGAAFSGCTKLENVRLSANISSIPADAFRNCERLGSILIPERVYSIGDYAFNGCSNLSYVYFDGGEKRLSAIGVGVFHGTPWFELQTDEFVVVGNGVLIKYNGTAKQVTLPWDAFYISDAFENNTVIEEVTLADWTRGILANAFRNCSSLKTVNRGNWITSIGSRAFENCISLVSFTVLERVKSIGTFAFAGCVNLKEISLLPDQLKVLQQGTFKDCKSLKAIVLPPSIIEIGANAFESCQSLESLQMGKNVKKIGNAAFSGCSALSSLQMPDGITRIGQGAFQNAGLRAITLPASLEKLEANLFHGCSQLEKIALPDSLAFIDETAFPDPVPLLLVPDKAALSGKAQIPEDSNTISLAERFAQEHVLQYAYQPVKTDLYVFQRDKESGTFTILRSLRDDWKEIIMPTFLNGSLVTTIGTVAFQDKTQLESVVIGDFYEKIEDWSFSYCPKLKEVTIGKSVTMIGADAFNGDSSLETVIIPPSVQTFGERAFKDCPKLTIIGAAGSAAESFANKNGISFRNELPAK